MFDLAKEKEIFRQGYGVIGALDEAGRGPLAGPVVVACVIIKANFSINNQLKEVNDSKKLTAAKRELLFDIIKRHFIEIGVGVSDHRTIDRINILQATFLAMKKAVGSIKNKPSFLLIDGPIKLPNCSTPQQAFVKGDEKIFTIAAASIMAKVARDRIMLEMDKLYPNYGFSRHKGYGTKDHLEKLKQYGPCPIHRLSFRRVSS
ncbi:ribonuclease HII [Candidatus Falkowbacteria bacterium RIFCSPLOWO2_12_FULL_45_13]|uniref:Ribonuclease HII n=1 Tax=Candidatus Falkowbacteria bacterium RIFCSPLOWO2_12_FULL_45_13 TaxID=1797991 RepID=A0A1F5SWF3_9BACT|nr:MAG: ribonuclease HII [Candidatus Falkowbacteria bacterium RIFCSPLOWO2_12_FULL_45_13]